MRKSWTHFEDPMKASTDFIRSSNRLAHATSFLPSFAHAFCGQPWLPPAAAHSCRHSPEMSPDRSMVETVASAHRASLPSLLSCQRRAHRCLQLRHGRILQVVRCKEAGPGMSSRSSRQLPALPAVQLYNPRQQLGNVMPSKTNTLPHPPAGAA